MTYPDPISSPPPAQGVRRLWDDIPLSTRIAIEAWWGSPVVSAISQPSGFSPGVAARLRTANGRRVFVKAVGSTPNPISPTMHRREIQIAAQLPANVPTPRLLWSLDDTETGWVVLIFEEIEGRHPLEPWEAPELRRVMDALSDMSDILTPSPLSIDLAGDARDEFRDHLSGWRRLHDDPPEIRDKLDDWSRRHLDTLTRLEANAPEAVVGNTLLHFDIRADNLLLSEDRVWLVDWPLACVGAAWVDIVFFAPSVAMQGGLPPNYLIKMHPAFKTADPDAVTAAIAAIAGFFTRQALHPPPPGLPTLRAFQDAQGKIARGWLVGRTGLS